MLGATTSAGTGFGQTQPFTGGLFGQAEAGLGQQKVGVLHFAQRNKH